MILNIHGFASNGSGNKYKALKETFVGETVISPDLPVDPVEALEILENIINNDFYYEEDIKIVGTSLGGFYALYLSSKYKLPALLVNPSVDPKTTMTKKIGIHTNYKTGCDIELTKEHVNTLVEMQKIVNYNHKDRIVLLGENDDVIDPTITQEVLKDAKIKVYDDNHRFSQFKEVIQNDKEIKDFLYKY